MKVTIETIDDVLRHVHGRSDFVVVDKGWYTVIDYVYADENTFTGEGAEIRRQCRGIKFCSVTGKILARPFHKFFNIGEREDTQIGVLDFSQPHRTMMKRDGSMIHPVVREDGEIVLMTRMGDTDVARKAYVACTPAHESFIWGCAKENVTPIFEFTAPNNRIVISYATPALTLLAVRDNVTGEYLWDRVTDAEGIPVVGTWGAWLSADPAGLLKTVKAWTLAEGVVIAFHSGDMVKLKADQYVMQHRAKDKINLEKNVLAVILDNAEDDLIPLLDGQTADSLRDYAGLVRHGLRHSAWMLTNFVNNAVENVDSDRKAFATVYIPTLPLPILKGAAFHVYGGGDAYEVMVDLVKRNLGSRTNVDSIRPLIGGAEWRL